MVNIYEVLQRAVALMQETALNSISPERAGGIMRDTLLALNDLWLQQGSALVISKIYASVAAMEADTAPVSDLTGKPLKPGQIVVIASSDSDNGSVYRYNGTDAPSWSLVGAIGNLTTVDSLDSDSTTLPLAAHQGKVLDGKIGQLGQKVSEIDKVEIITTESPSLEIKKDNNDTVVKVTNAGVELAGHFTLNDTDIEDEIEGKQDKIDELEFYDETSSNEEIVIADDDKNRIASFSIGEPSLETDTEIWANDELTEEYARIGKKGITAKGFYKQNGDTVGNQPYTIVVDQGGHGDYTNIVDALNNAGDTSTKHITIIINEGIYNMPPKVSGVAPYVEENRNLTLRGTNRKKCVLLCDIGFYDYTIGTDCATLRLAGNLTIENLTIISSNEQYNSKIGTPGYVTERTNRKAAYCIHLDQSRLEGDAIVVRNCTLIDNQMAAIGFGTRKDSVIRVEDCYLQCEQAATDSEANNYGVIWGHNQDGASGNVGGQRIELIRNQLVHKTGPLAFRYSYAAVTGDTDNLDCVYCLIGNSVKTTDLENALLVSGFPEGTITKDALSFGNQCEAMNV